MIKNITYQFWLKATLPPAMSSAMYSCYCVLSWWVNDRILKDHSLMRTCPRDDCSPIPDENLPDWVFSRPISEQVCPANEKLLFCVKREGNVYETAISWIGCTSVLYTTSTHKYTQKTGESGLLGHNEKKREGFKTNSWSFDARL